ncbi:hypothetical protein CYMTET_14209 [Cymbomonas tetramitiformis]|uniref:Uncharacterized protein n=1 Tax=Cymbomonas tetramitiformis TaxID=36881 RepID=A0AAE0GGW3_9CHLO|nr:hypothetical protein CYMTET_14209 [Cymbomonas tetramitiformis]
MSEERPSDGEGWPRMPRKSIHDIREALTKQISVSGLSLAQDGKLSVSSTPPSIFSTPPQELADLTTPITSPTRSIPDSPSSTFSALRRRSALKSEIGQPQEKPEKPWDEMRMSEKMEVGISVKGVQKQVEGLLHIVEQHSQLLGELQESVTSKQDRAVLVERLSKKVEYVYTRVEELGRDPNAVGDARVSAAMSAAMAPTESYVTSEQLHDIVRNLQDKASGLELAELCRRQSKELNALKVQVAQGSSHGGLAHSAPGVSSQLLEEMLGGLQGKADATALEAICEKFTSQVEALKMQVRERDAVRVAATEVTLDEEAGLGQGKATNMQVFTQHFNGLLSDKADLDHVEKLYDKIFSTTSQLREELADLTEKEKREEDDRTTLSQEIHGLLEEKADKVNLEALYDRLYADFATSRKQQEEHTLQLLDRLEALESDLRQVPATAQQACEPMVSAAQDKLVSELSGWTEQLADKLRAEFKNAFDEERRQQRAEVEEMLVAVRDEHEESLRSMQAKMQLEVAEVARQMTTSEEKARAAEELAQEERDKLTAGNQALASLLASLNARVESDAASTETALDHLHSDLVKSREEGQSSLTETVAREAAFRDAGFQALKDTLEATVAQAVGEEADARSRGFAEVQVTLEASIQAAGSRCDEALAAEAQRWEASSSLLAAQVQSSIETRDRLHAEALEAFSTEIGAEAEVRREEYQTLEYELTAALMSEAEARVNDVAAEAEARLADAAAVQQQVQEETQQRHVAVADLAEKVQEETQQRHVAVADLTAAAASETQAREAAQAALREELDAEAESQATDLADWQGQISNRLVSESDARDTAISDCLRWIQAESAERSNSLEVEAETRRQSVQEAKVEVLAKMQAAVEAEREDRLGALQSLELERRTQAAELETAMGVVVDDLKGRIAAEVTQREHAALQAAEELAALEVKQTQALEATHVEALRGVEAEKECRERQVAAVQALVTESASSQTEAMTKANRELSSSIEVQLQESAAQRIVEESLVRSLLTGLEASCHTSSDAIHHLKEDAATSSKMIEKLEERVEEGLQSAGAEARRGIEELRKQAEEAQGEAHAAAVQLLEAETASREHDIEEVRRDIETEWVGWKSAVDEVRMELAAEMTESAAKHTRHAQSVQELDGRLLQTATELGRTIEETVTSSTAIKELAKELRLSREDSAEVNAAVKAEAATRMKVAEELRAESAQRVESSHAELAQRVATVDGELREIVQATAEATQERCQTLDKTVAVLVQSILEETDSRKAAVEETRSELLTAVTAEAESRAAASAEARERMVQSFAIEKDERSSSVEALAQKVEATASLVEEKGAQLSAFAREALKSETQMLTQMVEETRSEIKRVAEAEAEARIAAVDGARADATQAIAEEVKERTKALDEARLEMENTAAAEAEARIAAVERARTEAATAIAEEAKDRGKALDEARTEMENTAAAEAEALTAVMEELRAEIVQTAEVERKARTSSAELVMAELVELVGSETKVLAASIEEVKVEASQAVQAEAEARAAVVKEVQAEAAEAVVAEAKARTALVAEACGGVTAMVATEVEARTQALARARAEMVQEAADEIRVKAASMDEAREELLQAISDERRAWTAVVEEVRVELMEAVAAETERRTTSVAVTHSELERAVVAEAEARSCATKSAQEAQKEVMQAVAAEAEARAAAIAMEEEARVAAVEAASKTAVEAAEGARGDLSRAMRAEIKARAAAVEELRSEVLGATAAESEARVALMKETRSELWKAIAAESTGNASALAEAQSELAEGIASEQEAREASILEAQLKLTEAVKAETEARTTWQDEVHADVVRAVAEEAEARAAALAEEAEARAAALAEEAEARVVALAEAQAALETETKALAVSVETETKALAATVEETRSQVAVVRGELVEAVETYSQQQIVDKEELQGQLEAVEGKVEVAMQEVQAQSQTQVQAKAEEVQDAVAAMNAQLEQLEEGALAVLTKRIQQVEEGVEAVQTQHATELEEVKVDLEQQGAYYQKELHAGQERFAKSSGEQKEQLQDNLKELRSELESRMNKDRANQKHGLLQLHEQLKTEVAERQQQLSSAVLEVQADSEAKRETLREGLQAALVALNADSETKREALREQLATVAELTADAERRREALREQLQAALASMQADLEGKREVQREELRSAVDTLHKLVEAQAAAAREGNESLATNLELQVIDVRKTFSAENEAQRVQSAALQQELRDARGAQREHEEQVLERLAGGKEEAATFTRSAVEEAHAHMSAEIRKVQELAAEQSARDALQAQQVGDALTIVHEELSGITAEQVLLKHGLEEASDGLSKAQQQMVGLAEEVEAPKWADKICAAVEEEANTRQSAVKTLTDFIESSSQAAGKEQARLRADLDASQAARSKSEAAFSEAIRKEVDTRLLSSNSALNEQVAQQIEELRDVLEKEIAQLDEKSDAAVVRVEESTHGLVEKLQAIIQHQMDETMLDLKGQAVALQQNLKDDLHGQVLEDLKAIAVKADEMTENYFRFKESIQNLVLKEAADHKQTVSLIEEYLKPIKHLLPEMKRVLQERQELIDSSLTKGKNSRVMTTEKWDKVLVDSGAKKPARQSKFPHSSPATAKE